MTNGTASGRRWPRPVLFGASILLGASLCLPSCGGGQSAAGGGASADAGPTFTSVGATAGSGASCQAAADCAAAETCHPYTGTCVALGPTCSGHADCDIGRYCDSVSGTCLPGATGSPCDTDDNCAGGSVGCSGAVCGCTGVAHEQELRSGPLDIYFIFDRTASMGDDCAYQPGASPPRSSKACFATFALSDFLIGATSSVDTRFAFQFMSQPNDCDGRPYTTPLVGFTQLPVDAGHPLIQAISNETFEGGLGTHIEGALRGMTEFTRNNVTPGREMIGVLMTDGDPNGCNENIGALRTIIADQLAQTGIRTFVIGMEGATERNLEELATAGGADPHRDWCSGVRAPCHYWNVGDGSGDALASALQGIIEQAAPLPCDYAVESLTPPPGETLDFDKVNVTFTAEDGTPMTIGQAGDEAACPADQLAWYYDNPAAPATIHLCPNACEFVKTVARVDVVVGCQQTVSIR